MTIVPEHAVVWAEIPVSDLAKSTAFYEAVMGWPLISTESKVGQNPMALFPAKNPVSSVTGHLYPGRPASDGSGPTVHLAIVGTVEEAAQRCAQAGGTVIGPVHDVPAGRVQYATDLDGNSIGLWEWAA
ncbi:VOC family protein [Krasilnikovia cinnamomea]|nr:VOC family protein [Krasilnikovia cinnamomea]